MSSWLGVMSPMEACMSSSLGAMGPVLRKLDSLLLPEYRLSKPLQDGIRLLKEDLEEISADLEEQSTVHSPNEMSNYWMNEVREISYDIDDFLDNMMLRHTDAADTKIRHVRRHRVGRVKTAWRSKTLKPCTRAAKIAELRALVREASERHDMYLDGCTSSPRCVFTTGHGQTPALYAVAANYLVGIDDSKMNLVQLLTNKTEQQLKVVSIVGPAGVGKTTLANQVYRELEEQLECRAFVRASRKPDMARLLAGILSQVQQCSGPSDSCTVQDLIDNLKKHLQDKRYVIVIDDLWETIAWDIVTSAFPEGNNCSRIVTTAQIEGVALECCDYQSNNILKMKPLGREDSRKLFFNMVFGPERSCPEQLKEVSDIAITKCAGLPLATICVAGLLASQSDNSEVWQHVQGYLCSSLSTNSTLEETLQEILKLSYNSLPHYLKTCLMYLGMYPVGYTMWKDDLVKQWVAECFISATEGQDREEVAESYFDELVNRGMIQPVEISYNDEVLSCSVHQVVLDLIAHKSNEEKFITALDYSQTITGLYRKARRLSLHFSNTRYATKPTALTLSQVRSLAFFGMLKCMPSIVKFKLLRVLVLEFWGDLVRCTSFDLTGVCRLVQLRYLKISGDASIEVELPAQMRRLQYLKTLKINARVSAVPLDLPGLLHLSLGDETKVPYGIGRIRSLRTLEYFDLGKNSKKSVLSLGELINLQDLHLTYSTVNSPELLKRKLAALASSIAKLINLKSVTMAPGALDTAIYHDCSSSMSYPQVFLQRLELLSPICIFSRIPEWIGQLNKLCILKVVVSELLMNAMDMLTGLPALTILSLYVRQPTAESIIFKRGAFPVLKCFNYRCGELCLAFQEEALPNLQRLDLSFNAHKGEQYGDLLAGIENLLNLKEIAGRIGAATGAEEPDSRAAESAFNDAIRKHPKFPSYNIERVDWVEEEYGPQEKQHLIREKEPSNEQPGIREQDSMENIKQDADSDLCSYDGVQSQVISSYPQLEMAGIMVSASTGVMNSLLGKLATLMEEFAMVKNLRKEVEFISKELTSTRDALERLSDVDELDKQTKGWRDKVREMSYDTEDIVDDFMHHIGNKSKSNDFFKKTARLLRKLRAHHQFPGKVEEIKKLVFETSELRKRYNLDTAIPRSSDLVVDPRVKTLYEKAANLVGVEGPTNELVNWLEDEEKQLNVVSIVGFGGLGKTTIANVVYNRLKVKFDRCAFVPVSQKPDIRKLLHSLLSQVESGQSFHDRELNVLIDMLRERLQNKRYLIIIDDIWDAKAWNFIKCAFPENDLGSRVIATTRVQDVAEACCSHPRDYILKMKPLSDEDSRRLFFDRIFGSEEVCPRQLKDVSVGVLKKCGGLPLAIISISGLLACKGTNQEEWEDVRNSLGSRRNLTLDRMRQILNLSYKNLPPRLKTCLLYLGMYPEDFTIARSDLERQWIAEGFVSKENGQDMEKVARNYFNELVNRSLVQPVKFDIKGSVIECKVHDMMLELILHKSTEENFLTVVDAPEAIKGMDYNKVRRLSIHGARNGRMLMNNISLSQVRSVMIFGSSEDMYPLSKFRFLRVLHVVHVVLGWGKVDLTGLCELYQLRYLKIGRNFHLRYNLPTQIRGLQHLETLDVPNCMNLPSDIVHLPRLLFLNLNKRGPMRGLECHELPDGIENMKLLRYLDAFDLYKNSIDNIEGLGELTNLRNLTVSFDAYRDVYPDGGDRRMDVLCSSLGKICSSLEHLHLDFEGCMDGLMALSPPPRRLETLHVGTGCSSSWLSRVPNWMGELRNLSELLLEVAELPKDGVGMLAELPSLLDLWLYIKAPVTETIVIYGRAFPVLKRFLIQLSSVSYLTFQAGAMPMLQGLELHFNAHASGPRSAYIPAGIEHLAALEEVDATIGCEGATESDKTSVESALRSAINRHPNHHRVKIVWYGFWLPFKVDQ